MPVFETSVTLDCPQERAFDFLLRPANVVAISTPEMGLNFTNPPEVVTLGCQLEFRIQGFGQVQSFLHEITALVPFEKISEKQLKGLFSHWVHDHLLVAGDAGGVTVIDRIEFAPPAGLLKFLVTERRVLDQLEEGFEHRHEQMKKLLTGA